jgi:hypothetical protein
MLILLILACVPPGLFARQQPTPAASDSLTPVIDHHQHLFSPAVQTVSPTLQPMNANELVKLLDEAGIRRAVVLSLGYQYGNPHLAGAGGYDDPTTDGPSPCSSPRSGIVTRL